MCPLRIEQNMEMMDQIVDGNPAAKAALDMALHDVLGKTVDKPLFILLSGYRIGVLTDITLSVKPPAEMATVGPDVEAEDDVDIAEIPGGLYAV